MAASPGASWTRWLWPGFAAALGLLFAWYTWSRIDDHRALSSRGVKADAVVAGYEDVRGKYGMTYYPVFRFAAEGRPVQATSGAAADPSELRRGQRVVVVYDPADPSRVRHADALAAGLGPTPWVTGLLALLMFGLASLFVLPSRAKPRG
jgi:hypothetical protein